MGYAIALASRSRPRQNVKSRGDESAVYGWDGSGDRTGILHAGVGADEESAETGRHAGFAGRLWSECRFVSEVSGLVEGEWREGVGGLGEE